MFNKKRPDGTYLKNLHFFTQLMPYLAPTRTGASVYFEQELDVTKTLQYVQEKKAKWNITFFYIVLFAAIRVIALRPKLNRFISGYRYYQRNRISFNFTAKRELNDEGEEINVTMSFSPLLSIEEFCKKIYDRISSVKKGEGTSAEKTNSLLVSLPRFLIRFATWGVRFLDYHNGLPKSVINSLPFWTTVFFANLGSIGIDAPFHHMFDLGNCGLFCAIGKFRKVNFIKDDGTVETRDKVKITFTYDNRITDGIYCARAIDMVKDLVENPEKLEAPLQLTQEQLDYLKLAKSELE